MDAVCHHRRPRRAAQVVFTEPQVAWVGPDRAGGREAGLDVRGGDVRPGRTSPGRPCRRALRRPRPDASSTTPRQVIVGATFVGPDAGRDAARRHHRGRRRGAPRPALARRPRLPDGQRGLAPPPGGLRPLTRRTGSAGDGPMPLPAPTGPLDRLKRAGGSRARTGRWWRTSTPGTRSCARRCWRRSVPGAATRRWPTRRSTRRSSGPASDGTGCGRSPSPAGWVWRTATNLVRRHHRRHALEQRLLRRHPTTVGARP